MLPQKVRAFAGENHQAVLTTFRRDGGAQMSIVSVGPYRDAVAFTTTADRAKLTNLRRNPRCSLMVSQRDWWGYVVLEGRAELVSPGVGDPEELRLSLREVYTAASGQEHPDLGRVRPGDARRGALGGDSRTRADIRYQSVEWAPGPQRPDGIESRP